MEGLRDEREGVVEAAHEGLEGLAIEQYSEHAVRTFRFALGVNELADVEQCEEHRLHLAILVTDHRTTDRHVAISDVVTGRQLAQRYLRRKRVLDDLVIAEAEIACRFGTEIEQFDE